VLEIVRAGHSFARIENGRVLFKAEIGAHAGSVCQVQGVWVDPALRGRGFAAPGMAAVVEEARALGLTDVTLYVNDYNTAARATYARAGFREVDVFASVLF
jgi:predicted GNAT family acetyltransferase